MTTRMVNIIIMVSASLLAIGLIRSQAANQLLMSSTSLPPPVKGGQAGSGLAIKQPRSKGTQASGDSIGLLKEFETNESLRAQNENAVGDAALARIDKVRSAEAEYDIFVYQNRRENLEWQMRASKWVFLIVATIVLSGLVLAIWQFFRPVAKPIAVKGNLARNENSKDVGSKSSEDVPVMTATSFEASTTGIKISSPVLGVIILAMSMVFFYLYVVKVYPITEIGHQSGADLSPAAK